MSLLVDPDPRKTGNKVAAQGTAGAPVQKVDELPVMDAYEAGLVDGARRTGEWFENPNPFAAKPVTSDGDLLVVDETTVQTVPVGQKVPASVPAEQKAQQAPATTSTQAPNGASVQAPQKSRVDDLIAEAEELIADIDARMAVCEDSYVANGGDLSKLKALQEESEQKAASQVKSAKSGRSNGKTGKANDKVQPDRTNNQAKPGKVDGATKSGKANGNLGGGDKMAKKLSDEEIAEIDPIIEQILQQVESVPPSHQDEILKAAQEFVAVCWRNKVSPEVQTKLIELYRKIEKVRARTAKADKQSQEKARNRQRVLGI